jgi:hypothetical protein
MFVNVLENFARYLIIYAFSRAMASLKRASAYRAYCNFLQVGRPGFGLWPGAYHGFNEATCFGVNR